MSLELVVALVAFTLALIAILLAIALRLVVEELSHLVQENIREQVRVKRILEKHLG